MVREVEVRLRPADHIFVSQPGIGAAPDCDCVSLRYFRCGLWQGPAYGEAGSSSAPSRPVQAVATTRPQQEAVVASKPPHKVRKAATGESAVRTQMQFA